MTPRLNGDPDHGNQLLGHVSGALTRYVVLPSPDALVAVTLWIAATHAAPAWNTAARLVIRAPEKRCGKSRLLDIIEAICHHPVMTVNATPSAIYRLVGGADGDPPTILIDEADTIFGDNAGAHEDLRGLLNAGHQRGRHALRWDVNTRTVEELDTYAMAALAGIGHLPDTIEDRAVIIRMRRRAPNETVRPYRLRRDAPPLNRLRTRVHLWVRANLDTLTTATPDMPLEDRAADTWEALIALADLAGHTWPTRARAAALALTDQADSDDTTLAAQLLADCQAAFDGRDTIRTSELLAVLKADPEAPWATHNLNGIHPRTLATMLKEFGITSRPLRFGNGDQQRGYAAVDFTDAWSRYLAPNPEARHIRHTRHNPRSDRMRLVTDSPLCDGSPPSHNHGPAPEARS